MTASVHILQPRKPKRLKTPSDKLSKRELTAKVMRISKAQAAARKAKASP